MKISAEAIARAALEQLNESGLDGLTMRQVAQRLGVQVATLYWHLKNKRQLLDAMADVMMSDAADGLEAPRREESWADWSAAWAWRLRATMLRYRDGGRVFAGTAVTGPDAYRRIELMLRALQDGGFAVRDAARSFPVILHYTVGFTIEEQARTGADYADEDNPYRASRLFQDLDATRFPLTAEAHDNLFEADTDAGFEHGLRVVLAGMSALYLG
ncbi:TetR/AcrR family transcriptional regulator C-terminal domain-containing protein [Kitasatospora kifunensis]|uniref:TetR/AcrR family tetracycline transcriptional repressor n=1 Tax=Kitasatospora kifunensis TaxID=58351 RepID=A0A7W7VVC0_KITKI|nr:TetR/AcrR family transcriptional regulator C-terminal domain-containing protein [Kitasatospora kifunensis]MBB4924226.1 TetR/AcrR family tetracycline transcriptional repressor [Kitasatospora kifunensis]